MPGLHGHGYSPMIETAREDRVCPLCRTGAHSRLFADARFDPSRVTDMSYSSRKPPERMHHRLLECASCDLVYASPIPSVESLNDAYHDAAYDSTLEARYAAVTYRQILDRIVGKLPDLRGAVDIGAGDGKFLDQLRHAGFDRLWGSSLQLPHEPLPRRRYGRTFAQSRSHRSPPGGRVHARELPPDDRARLRSPRSLSGRCRVLAPGGAVMIVCHGRRALTARLPNRSSPIFDIEHLQLFSPKSVRMLLTEAGFDRITVARFRSRYPLGYWVRLAPLPARGVPERIQNVLAMTRLSKMPIRIHAGNLVAVGYKQSRERVSRWSATAPVLRENGASGPRIVPHATIAGTEIAIWP